MITEITRVRQFETSETAEAKGQVMAAWLTNQLEDETRPRLSSRGIESLDFDEWYPFQLFLDVMREIVEEKDNVTMTLVAVGKAVVEHLPLSDFATMDDFKAFAENIHHGVSVRNAPKNENWYLFEEDGQYYLLNNTPVSNDIAYGFLWEVLHRYKIDEVYYNPIPHEDYPSNELGSVFLLEPVDS